MTLTTPLIAMIAFEACSGYLFQAGLETPTTLSAAIAACVKFGLIDQQEADHLYRLRDSGNQARHQWWYQVSTQVIAVHAEATTAAPRGACTLFAAQ